MNNNIMNVRLIRDIDEDYPKSLLKYDDCPRRLFLQSDNQIDLSNYKKVAIVGSRDATPYALDMAYKFAYELAKENIVIVSGMAKGVDAAAHQGAIDAGGITVAVLGNGIDICYPEENKKLMGDIKNTGLIVSEYPPKTKPLKENFPRRNRIISGLSDFVLVVEAKERSGSLITARIALDYGLDVGVIPANIDEKNGKGSNMLLRDGAYPILEPKDILELL